MTARFPFQKFRQRLKLFHESRLIRSSDLFDREWYIQNHPEVSQTGVDPVQHYLLQGGFEGQNPGPNFHSRWYMSTYEDVLHSRLNPLVHYLRYGKKEGRKACPLIFKLKGMYEYSKQTDRIVFEESPEQVYMQRPALIGGFGGKLQEGEALCPTPYVSVLEHVVILGGENFVITDTDLILSDELAEFTSSEFGKKTTRLKPYEDQENAFLLTGYETPTEHIKECILLSCGHDENYFHWLVECLPKLLLIDSLEEFKDIPLVVPGGLHHNLLAALERVNVHNRPILFLEMGTACSVERLIFPSALSRILDRFEGSPVFNQDIVLSHKWLAKLVERLKANVNYRKKPWRKIYLARRKGRRALGNRDEVELKLLKQGFEIVELDGASLAFQIELFSQAAVVVAPTGAALTNMLFCQPGTRVIIFMSNHEVTNFYFWMNLGAINHLDITTVVGERQFHRIGYYSVHDDFIVDADLVLDVLGRQDFSRIHPSMSYSRYLFYKTFVSSIIEKCSPWNSPSLSAAESDELRLFLEAIEHAIQLEIYKVQSRQAGGYWQITNGDRAYTRCLGRILLAIHSVYDHPSPGGEECRLFIENLKQLLETAESNQDPRLKAVFFVQEKYTWPSLESVFEAFDANPDCQAQLVYVDSRHVNNDNRQDWFTEYKKLGMPVVHCNDYDLSKESPDLAFFLKPYDNISEQFYIKEIDKIVRRSVYIPYFVNWMALRNIDLLINYHFQLPLHEKAWKIFDSPDFILKSHIEYGARKGENVELVGHPRYDVMGKLEKRRAELPEPWKEKFANKRVVMWNSHSYIATENWSTFANFGQRVLEYFKNNQQLALLWRPHPHFFNSLLNGGVMTAAQVDELIAGVTNSDNMILDQTSDYLNAFSVADALMSDASSILVEFLLLQKPILYTYNESNYSIVHESLLPAFYQAGSWEEAETFLQMLIDGKDNKLDDRRKVVGSFMPNVDKGVGRLIMDKCIKDLIAEEVHSAKALPQPESERIGIH